MKLIKDTSMKKLLFTMILIFANTNQVFASDELKSSMTQPFVCIDMASPIYSKVKTAMKKTAEQLSMELPDFARYGFGYGNCIDLKKKSVLSVAVGHELSSLPDTCVGFSLAVSSSQELEVLARQLVNTQDAVIDGKNGSMILLIDGNQINVPICLESFSFGGPQ